MRVRRAIALISASLALSACCLQITGLDENTGSTGSSNGGRGTAGRPVACKLEGPPSVDFGSVAVTPAMGVSREITLTNVGSANCQVAAVALGAGSDTEFSLSSGEMTPVTISPGANSPPFKVTFEGTSTVLPLTRTATLIVQSDDPSGPSLSIPLTAELLLCLLSPTPDPLDLGEVIPNKTISAGLTLANQGSTECVLFSAALTATTDPEFSLNPVTSTTIAPGGAAMISISFDAYDTAAPFLRTGGLTLQTSDPNQPTLAVPLEAYVSTACSEAAQYVYTVDANSSELSRFDPSTLSFTDIGLLNCDPGSTPASMTVDQNAVAWVLYFDGNLFQVSTSDASCQSTSFVPDQDDLLVFGMGSAFQPSTGVDTLYIAGGPGQQWSTPPATLATISFPGLIVSPVGSISDAAPELTGTGDGELWGFAPGQESTFGFPVAERYDEDTAAILERYDLSGITMGSGSAFAMKFWGGSFWVFLGGEVWQVPRSTLVGGMGAATPVMPSSPPSLVLSTNRNISGAGVSSCAPTQ